MLAYVLGHLLHEGHLGGLGPVQYIPSGIHSKQKVGKATLTQDYWAYPENRDSCRHGHSVGLANPWPLQ